MTAHIGPAYQHRWFMGTERCRQGSWVDAVPVILSFGCRFPQIINWTQTEKLKPLKLFWGSLNTKQTPLCLLLVLLEELLGWIRWNYSVTGWCHFDGVLDFDKFGHANGLLCLTLLQPHDSKAVSHTANLGPETPEMASTERLPWHFSQLFSLFILLLLSAFPQMVWQPSELFCAQSSAKRTWNFG